MTISTLLQLKVQEKIQQCLDLILGEETARYFKVQVEFKTTLGLCAGLAYCSESRIVLNEALFLKNQDEFFNETIPHEVAHILQYVLYPKEKLSHGRRWKEIMIKLGLKPSVYHHMDISAVDDKVYRYTCACDGGFRYHQIPEAKHKRLQKSTRALQCGTCKTRIIYFPKGDCQ